MRNAIFDLIEMISGSKNPTNARVKTGVEETLRDYKSTLKYLEKYDKGEISNPQVLAKHRNLRSYIQSL